MSRRVPDPDQIAALAGFLRALSERAQTEAQALQSKPDRRNRFRNARGLRDLSKLVRQLKPDDQMLAWLADEPLIDGELDLGEQALDLLDEFWVQKADWPGNTPSNHQLRRILARVGRAQTRPTT